MGLSNVKFKSPCLKVNYWPTWYRVTRVIVNDFKSVNLYVVSFINRHTLCRSIGMINKIIWSKYYTDSCSATVIIFSSVATRKNCTIMRRQRYSKPVRKLNINTEQCLLCFRWLTSVCRASNRWDFLHSGQRNWSPRFLKTTFECRHWAGINSCSHNAPNVFNRRQIWRIWRPISRLYVMSGICYCE